jgi:hypothetical protein
MRHEHSVFTYRALAIGSVTYVELWSRVCVILRVHIYILQFAL